MKSHLSLKHKVAKISEIPEDVALGIPLITVLGSIEIDIENYGGIIEYTDSLIRIRTRVGQIIIKGKALHIENYTSDEMKIHGIINSIEFNH